MEEKINFTELVKKPHQQKCFLFAVMRGFLKPAIFWKWTDIAICFRVYQPADFADYHIAIDIQILWFNLWVQFFKKKWFPPSSNQNNKLDGYM
jgi:hypothetical protein